MFGPTSLNYKDGISNNELREISFEDHTLHQANILHCHVESFVEKRYEEWAASQINLSASNGTGYRGNIVSEKRLTEHNNPIRKK
jgi:hypothetical protein